MALTRAAVLQSVANLLIYAGVTMLVVVGASYAYGFYAEVQVQRRIPDEPLALLPPVPENARVAPVPMPPARRIVIPRIGVDARVVEVGLKLVDGEWEWEVADHAVGHHEGTPNPGEVGNAVMSGHISSPVRGQGEVFKRLPEMLPGDEVILFTDEAQFLYQTKEVKIVLPTDVSVMAPTPDQSLTLITCFPDLIYSHRFIVIAKPYHEAAPAVAPARAR